MVFLSGASAPVINHTKPGRYLSKARFSQPGLPGVSLFKSVAFNKMKKKHALNQACRRAGMPSC